MTIGSFILGLFFLSLPASIAGMEVAVALMLLYVLYLASQHYFLKKSAGSLFLSLGGREKWWRADWALGVFLFFVACGAILLPGLPSSREVIGEARWVVLLYILVALLSLERMRLPQLFLFLFSVFSVICVYGVLQAFTGVHLFKGEYMASQYGNFAIWRPKGFFSNTMSFSYSAGMLLCLLMGFWLRKSYQTGRALFIFAAIVLGAVTLFLTFTRGAWLAAAAAIFLMGLIHNRKRALVAFAGAVVLIGLSAAVLPPVRERLQSIVKEKEGSKSVSQRLELWQANWEMIKDHPLLGVGYGQNALFVGAYKQKLFGEEGFISNAHNNFLQVLGGAGVFAFLAWLYICGFFLVRAGQLFWRSRDNWLQGLALGSLGAQVFFHIGGLTQATFFDNETLYLLLFIWAVTAVFFQQEGIRAANRPA